MASVPSPSFVRSRETSVVAELSRAERLDVLRASDLLDSPPEDAFDRWTGWLSELLGVPTAMVSLVDDRRQFFKSIAGPGADDVADRATPVDGSFCQYVVATAGPLVINDVQEHHHLADHHTAVEVLHTVAYAGMPVAAEGQVLGALCVTSPEAREWTQQELALLEHASAAISAELSLRVSAQRLARAQRLVGAQIRVHQLIAGHAPLDRVLAELTDYLEVEFPGVSARAITTGDGTTGEATTTGAADAWRLPLRGGDGAVLGVLVVDDAPDREPTADEQGLLADAVRLATIAIERQRAHHLLTYQATHDTVTGLPNRNLLMDRLTQALTRARRTGASTAVFFADLDGFKPINDTFGHEVGDEVLVAIAQRLTHTMRASDTVARFGGDEFVILAEDVRGRHGAQVLADRLLRDLQRPLRTAAKTFSISASVGVAIVGADDSDAHDAIRVADAAMYAAKRAGGHRVVIADGGQPAET